MQLSFVYLDLLNITMSSILIAHYCFIWRFSQIKLYLNVGIFFNGSPFGGRVDLVKRNYCGQYYT